MYSILYIREESTSGEVESSIIFGIFSINLADDDDDEHFFSSGDDESSNIFHFFSINLAVLSCFTVDILSCICPFIFVLIYFLSGSYDQSSPAKSTSLRSLAGRLALMPSGFQASKCP